MWRVILSICAVVLNVVVLGVVALGCLGFAVALGGQADAPLSQTQLLGFAFVAFAGVTAVTSITAVAVGARLRGKAQNAASQVASTFS